MSTLSQPIHVLLKECYELDRTGCRAEQLMYHAAFSNTNPSLMPASQQPVTAAVDDVSQPPAAYTVEERMVDDLLRKFGIIPNPSKLRAQSQSLKRKLSDGPEVAPIHERVSSDLSLPPQYHGDMRQVPDSIGGPLESASPDADKVRARTSTRPPESRTKRKPYRKPRELSDTRADAKPSRQPVAAERPQSIDTAGMFQLLAAIEQADRTRADVTF